MSDATPLTAEDLRRATFAEAFRGYHPGHVDQVIERAAEDLSAGRPLDWLPAPGGIRRCFCGYRRADVERLLERLRSAAAPSSTTHGTGSDRAADRAAD